MPSRPADSAVAFRDEVRQEDADSVRDIVASTGFFHDFEVDVAVELVQERLVRGLASEYHFVVADDLATDRMIGYACFGQIPCTQGSADLYWVAVHKDSQGRGLGRALLERAEAAMRAGLPGPEGQAGPPTRRVYIETSSQPRYEPTWKFYERCGYAVEARLKDFYASGDDKLVYVKALMEPSPPNQSLQC
jgi:ribosomal protein S18 acetylase RimI-like enzyme